MSNLDRSSIIGVVGAGTMGRGIAQIAATYGHNVVLQEIESAVLENAKLYLERILNRLEEKGRLGRETAKETLARIDFVNDFGDFKRCDLVIEAIIENLSAKIEIFRNLEEIVSPECILATNTSSLSITSISAACQKPERVLGVHFFNPAPLMPLVEIIPGIRTSDSTVITTQSLISDWGNTTVYAKDTPGFIVNRVARPFYGEALRILEEGIADAATIDWAMKEIGGFKMGPFELMDLIGNDVNLKVTETVFAEFFFDPRFKPSITQKRMVEAGLLGKKAGQGYYDYSENAQNPKPKEDRNLGEEIVFRILVMLINEAADAVFLNIASIEDVDLAMTKGVNYPKGLLRWADEIGLEKVLAELEELRDDYGEDRYRANPLLRRMVRNKQEFYG
jgi:3-hydroxybutyryl-CoA dehydrogenase